MLFDSEAIVRYMRNMVGCYALNKAHLNIDNFGRVYYGEYIDNVHGLAEPYYELVGTLAPNFQTGGLFFMRDPNTDDDTWNIVNPHITDMLHLRAAV